MVDKMGTETRGDTGGKHKDRDTTAKAGTEEAPLRHSAIWWMLNASRQPPGKWATGPDQGTDIRLAVYCALACPQP